MHDIPYPFEFVDAHVKMNVTPFNGITFVSILVSFFGVDVHLKV